MTRTEYIAFLASLGFLAASTAFAATMPALDSTIPDDEARAAQRVNYEPEAGGSVIQRDRQDTIRQERASIEQERGEGTAE